MRIDWRREWPNWIVIAAMFLYAAVAWSTAPDRFPVHWDITGQVDRYGGKIEGLLALPATTLVLYLLLLLLPLVDPGRANYERFADAYAVMRLGITIMLAALYVATQLWARGHQFDLTRLVLLLSGGLLIVVGNFLGKIRPNWFVGIRTPWTLSSKTSWTKTHRLGGWLFIVIGFALIAAAVLRTEWSFWLAGAIAAACLLWITVYSYLVWRSDPDKIPPAGTSPG